MNFNEACDLSMFFLSLCTLSQIVCDDLYLSDSENSTIHKYPTGLRVSKEGEQARRLHQKSDFVKVFDSMRIPLGKFYVPLCEMIHLPKVRPIQEVDVVIFEKRFEGVILTVIMPCIYPSIIYEYHWRSHSFFGPSLTWCQWTFWKSISVKLRLYCIPKENVFCVRWESQVHSLVASY